MFITRLIRNVVDIFFVVVVFAMIGRGVDMVERTILWIMLGFRSFAVFAAVIRTERFVMTGSLALITNASSHVWGKDLVDKKR
jgi:hypothetical protein